MTIIIICKKISQNFKDVDWHNYIFIVVDEEYIKMDIFWVSCICWRFLLLFDGSVCLIRYCLVNSSSILSLLLLLIFFFISRCCIWFYYLLLLFIYLIFFFFYNVLGMCIPAVKCPIWYSKFILNQYLAVLFYYYLCPIIVIINIFIWVIFIFIFVIFIRFFIFLFRFNFKM